MRYETKWRKLSTSFFAILLLAAAADAAQTVVPNELANVEGNDRNAFPFAVSVDILPSQRYQQVFSATQFADFQGPQLITQLAFRPDVTGHAFSGTISNIQIDLSYTNGNPDGLSNIFSNNVGSNDTRVYSGALTLSSAFTGPPNGPKDFDVIIPLQTPFLYDPLAGNLLLDVRRFSAQIPQIFFDAQSTIGDSVSRVFTSSVEDVNSPTGFVDTTGLVVRFTSEPAIIPEPTSFTLLVVGIIFIIAYTFMSSRWSAAWITS